MIIQGVQPWGKGENSDKERQEKASLSAKCCHPIREGDREGRARPSPAGHKEQHWEFWLNIREKKNFPFSSGCQQSLRKLRPSAGWASKKGAACAPPHPPQGSGFSTRSLLQVQPPGHGFKATLSSPFHPFITSFPWSNNIPLLPKGAKIYPHSSAGHKWNRKAAATIVTGYFRMLDLKKEIKTVFEPAHSLLRNLTASSLECLLGLNPLFNIYLRHNLEFSLSKFKFETKKGK